MPLQAQTRIILTVTIKTIIIVMIVIMSIILKYIARFHTIILSESSSCKRKKSKIDDSTTIETKIQWFAVMQQTRKSLRPKKKNQDND